MSAILERIIDDAQALGDVAKLEALEQRCFRRKYDARRQGGRGYRADVLHAAQMALDNAKWSVTYRLRGDIAAAWRFEKAADGWIRHIERIRVELNRRKA